MLIRHGEAVSNAEDLVGGHAGCRGLTELGRRQVLALADRIRRTGELEEATALYSSILPRAVETAAILSPALGNIAYEAACMLCERHPGEADGLTWAECEERYGRLLPGDEPERPLSPGGESWLDLLDRAEEALYQVAGAHPGELIVVSSHGGIIGASLVRFLGLPEHGGLTALSSRQRVDNRMGLHRGAVVAGPVQRRRPPRSASAARAPGPTHRGPGVGASRERLSAHVRAGRAGAESQQA